MSLECVQVLARAVPGAPGRAQSSAALGSSATALPPAQTDREPAQLHLLGLLGHCPELLRPTRIWLACAHTPNANIWAGEAASPVDETLCFSSRPGREVCPTAAPHLGFPHLETPNLMLRSLHGLLLSCILGIHTFCQGCSRSQGTIPKYWPKLWVFSGVFYCAVLQFNPSSASLTPSFPSARSVDRGAHRGS